MQTSEERFLASLRSLGIGSQETPEVLKEAAAAAVEDTDVVEEEDNASDESSQPKQIKLAEMPLAQLMEDPNFLRGVTDRIAQRGYEIEAAIGRHLMSE